MVKQKIGGKRLEIGTKWLNKLVENDLRLGQNGFKKIGGQRLEIGTKWLKNVKKIS